MVDKRFLRSVGSEKILNPQCTVYKSFREKISESIYIANQRRIRVEKKAKINGSNQTFCLSQGQRVPRIRLNISTEAAKFISICLALLENVAHKGPFVHHGDKEAKKIQFILRLSYLLLQTVVLFEWFSSSYLL